MKELKCPNCGTVFTINEDNYAAILNQVRNDEFAKQVNEKIQQYEDNKNNEIKIVEANLSRKYNEDLTKKNNEIIELENKLESQKELMKRELENTKLQTSSLYKEEQQKLEMEITILKRSINDNKNKYELNIEEISREKNLAINNIKIETENKYKDEIKNFELTIAELNGRIKLAENSLNTEIEKVVMQKNEEISNLKSKINSGKIEYELQEKNLKEKYEIELKLKDEMIDYYKDFKSKQSTKMVGESLEQHCNYEFSKIRSMFSKNTYFEKDNDARTGSKGDFIFRDFDENGQEIISIMFEMKNESDTTSSKHKNEDFFKELDKDRKEKECDYAILVSLLELESDIYNAGIVDVSYKYDKMYVIRPQFFIPMITMLRNASLKSLDYKNELESYKNRNIDVSKFEENLNTFKEGFSRNYRLASEKFKKAIEEIDKTIDHLQKTKDSLISSENNLRIANNKADDLTIKKITSGNKTMSELFEKI